MARDAGEPAEVLNRGVSGRRWTRRWGVILGAVAVLAVAGLAIAWQLGARSVPFTPGGGWWSDDMESVDSSGLTETHRVFRCAPGELVTRLDIAGDGPVPVTVTDVRVPLVDDMLANTGGAVRISTQMMRDPYGADLDDLVDFGPTRVGGADSLRLVITWDVVECPEMSGYLIEERLEVTYVALGMTHTATVPQVAPFALTSLPLDQTP